MNNIFFVADTHFSSETAFKYTWSRRRFKSVEEVDEEIIKNWNNVVGKNDTVFHLGDFATNQTPLEKQIEYRKRLNGSLIMIRGNHDVFSKKDYEKAFDCIFFNNPCVLLLKNNAEKFMLCHYPVQRGLQNNSEYSLCGHIHEKWRVAKNMLNVGVDVSNFTPLSVEDVMFCVNAERNLHWDANVYPDSDIAWQWKVTQGRDVPGEPTRQIVEERFYNTYYY